MAVSLRMVRATARASGGASRATADRTWAAPMADTVRRVDYFYTTAPLKPGAGARLLGLLRDRGVNLLAFSGFPAGRRAQLDFVPADSAGFVAVAKAAKVKLSPPKAVFL